ncbi:nudix hydrolase 8-like [Euphorbia lathyris]|uniref:nudix hydrolase 8-like n=1 Tax=Euphorbia lathyris TaxID=212925 RepID=UPI00331376F1
MIMAATPTHSHWSSYSCLHYRQQLPRISSTKPSNVTPCLSRDLLKKRMRNRVMSSDMSAVPSITVDGWEDEYGGIIIDPNTLPSSSNAFASAIRASLSNWKLKGKRGIWLKLLMEQAELIPIAIQEGFEYHHAEPGYVMLTYWIPDEPCSLPATPSHHIGVAAFVVNQNKQILVVKEKCPCTCSGVWKMPTGYINKSEDIFSGVVREVKEETGVDTIFLKLVAFRHAHQLAFEKSDLLFICMLKPLSYKITIDEKEIEAAKWMEVDEFMRQPFYEEDQVSKRAMECCIAAYGEDYNGFTAHRLISKLDGNMSYLYYDGHHHLTCF